MPAQNKKATIQRAAELAGVSIASVSRALNGKAGISAKKRDEILQICETLGYSPHSLRMLPPKSGIVAVSMGSSENGESRYMSILWPALSIALQRSGRRLLPTHSTGIAANELDGIILLNVADNDSRISHLTEQKIPFVCIGSVANQFWVAPDDFNGMRQSVQHLVKQQCKNIACVAPKSSDVVYLHRLQGYRSAMGEHQMQCVEFYIPTHVSSELASYRYFLKMDIETLKQLDGLVCDSDEIAIGAKTALEDRGLSIPQDISIVGFDGFPHFSQGLTTIDQDIAKIAYKAADLLELAISGATPVGVVLPVTLKVGVTT